MGGEIEMYHNMGKTAGRFQLGRCLVELTNASDFGKYEH